MGSVLLFDEVQTLPLGLAIPTLGALAHLSNTYRTSVVFATATQPAFGHLDEPVRRWAGVGWQAGEMAPRNLFGRLRRTVVQWPDPDRALEWATVADSLAAQPQALCVVNLKRHARTLVERLKEAFSDGLFHLSTEIAQLRLARHSRVELEEAVRFAEQNHLTRRPLDRTGGAPSELICAWPRIRRLGEIVTGGTEFAPAWGKGHCRGSLPTSHRACKGNCQSRLWVNSGCAGQAAARQVNPNKRTPELEQTYLAIRHPPAG
jgi:hypothetical protein